MLKCPMPGAETISNRLIQVLGPFRGVQGIRSNCQGFMMRVGAQLSLGPLSGLSTTLLKPGALEFSSAGEVSFRRPGQNPLGPPEMAPALPNFVLVWVVGLAPVLRNSGALYLGVPSRNQAHF